MDILEHEVMLQTEAEHSWLDNPGNRDTIQFDAAADSIVFGTKMKGKLWCCCSDRREQDLQLRGQEGDKK